MKATVQVPLLISDVEFLEATEVTQVTFNGYQQGPVIPIGIGFKSKRFRITIEALDVTARLEGEDS